MMKKLFSILIFFLIALPVFSQEEVDLYDDCYELLDKARNDFEIGKLERVEPRIKGCLRKQLSTDLRKKILELLIESALFLNDQEKAEEYYLDLKFIDPFATFNGFVPELRYLSDKFVTFPSTTYSFHAGGTPNLVGIDMDGTPPGVELMDLNLKREGGDLFGWFAGVEAAFNVDNSRWDASVGYTFHKNYLHYAADLGNALFDPQTGETGPATLTFREQSHWSQLSLGLIYQFKKRDRFERAVSPYLFVRIGGIYNHNKAAKIFEPGIDFVIQDVLRTRNSLDIGPFRRDFLLSAKAGAAVRVRLYRHLFAQTGFVYHRILTNMGQEVKDYTPYNIMVDTFNFQDDNFTAHQIGIFAGFGIYLFKTKRK
ncbi:MAG: hypothetical protein DWQ02_20650 [Bacteroidetes bacterium]|nr:MAG: hypothetical protein DWQ02_20650 [Bacteroidota bacterium]